MTEKLENYGLQPGPAFRIAELVKEINVESKNIYFQYYDSILVEQNRISVRNPVKILDMNDMILQSLVDFE
ncbi:unnamed protein product [Rhizophagus irregularis]|nr:unnamed protein product [Rhizophagus irregularis]